MNNLVYDENLERLIDIKTWMLKEHRTFWVSGSIDSEKMIEVNTLLHYLESNNSEEEIVIYLNSDGGCVNSALAIVDTFKMISCPIAIYCVGKAYSAAAVILAAGTKGKRFALEHSEIMIHQVSGSFGGKLTDVNILAERMRKNSKLVCDILVRSTENSKQTIEQALENDNFISPLEAKEFGIIDEVISLDKLDKVSDR